MDKAMKKTLIERAARAFRSVDEPDLSEGLQLQYRLEAALEATGMFDPVGAAEETYAARWDTGIRCSTGPFLGALGRLGRALNRMKEQSND